MFGPEWNVTFYANLFRYVRISCDLLLRSDSVEHIFRY
jgi:hypothetical protein